jgi:hypothetical protein
MSEHELSTDINLLLHQLSSKDMLERMKAREALVEMGRPAVSAVAAIANAKDDHVRWECAKTLSQIADPSSADTLIALLEDSEEGTRWDAALGLISIGQPAVTPLLKAIIQRSAEFAIISGARHVMHELSKTQWGAFLRPVYEDLNSFVAREAAPVAAYQALQKWENSELSKSPRT